MTARSAVEVTVAEQLIERLGAEGPDLDELCRLAAREMIAVALEAERRAWLEAHADVVDAAGHRLVVGNGSHRQRTIVTGAGEVEVTAPRVADKRAKDEREPYSSAILAPYMRKSPKVTEVLPILYLGGCRPATSAPRWPGSSAPTLGCRPPRSTGSPRRGRPNMPSGPAGSSPRSTSSASGPTGCIRGCGCLMPTVSAIRCVCSRSWRTHRWHNSWWRSLMGIGSRPSRGPSCCATCASAGCGRRCWPSVTGRWDCGTR